ncbi:MAG: AAA family ATPase [Bacteroidaceae bacterium]|nr:AAA family ATPase [Bacteroidaceae bacterium]
MSKEQTNEQLDLAWQFVERTGVNVFLTGKAGTGKTTFLRRLKERSPKRMVVVAPTGVAAINAGGVTIHSFFQFPLAPYIPGGSFNSKDEKYRFSKEKKNIIRTLDLLVIDEISMVRADLLDQIDAVLRLHKDRHRPFGGVQLLMIGDLSQLAPVVKDGEWTLLREYYHTPYFFGSHALQQTRHVTIELTHVYRQTDRTFINILNEVRENCLTPESLALLNSRVDGQQTEVNSEFKIQNSEFTDGTIRLTTHNATANRYNEERMDALKGIRFSFKAKVAGTFPESSYPAEETLVLKKGCQVMFLKNDSQGSRYYNGKLGIVSAVDGKRICVRGIDDNVEIEVEPDVWTNARYVIDKETKEIREDIEGEFRQYPLRLAWAITVHKSQGLTFDRAVLDVNAAFASGQVYVALSRCRSLEGLVLTAPLSPSSVKTDLLVTDYMNAELEQAQHTAGHLSTLERDYYLLMLTELFSFKTLEADFHRMLRLIDEHLYKVYPLLLKMYKQADGRFSKEITAVAATFYRQYSTLVIDSPDYTTDELLAERIHKAATYFIDKLDDFLRPLVEHTSIDSDNQEIKERLTEATYNFKQSFAQKHYLLTRVIANGFNVSTYLKDKAIGLLNADQSAKRSAKSKPSEKIEVDRNSDIRHPKLFRNLRAWRALRAEELGRPAYGVLTQKALIGITNELPTSGRELLRMPGFGKKSLEMFGKEILTIVQEYIEEENIEEKNFIGTFH